jgi:hypothetical protein
LRFYLVALFPAISLEVNLKVPAMSNYPDAVYKVAEVKTTVTIMGEKDRRRAKRAGGRGVGKN